MSKIAVIGSLNMDLVFQLARLPLPGETMSGSDYAEHFGGKGANQAVAAARMGSDVFMIGAVGDDAFGHAMRQNLQKESIHTEGISVKSDFGSGKAVILVANGDNSIVLDGGANMALTPEDIRQNAPIIEQSDCVLLQLEIPMETVLEAAKIAHQKGVSVILNPAPAKEFPEELWQYIDVLIPNETEAAFYAGHAVSTEEEAEDAIRILNARGVEQIVITMGEKGAIYNCGDDVYRQVSRKVQAVDSTAAGDSFIGSFATALASGASFKDSVRMGSIVGSIVVTKHGAQDSIPHLTDVRPYFSNSDILSD